MFLIIYGHWTGHLPKKCCDWKQLALNEKAHLASRQMSFNALKRKIFSGLNTHSDLSSPRYTGLELTPYPNWRSWTGCQGVVGPYPSAFLDKCCGSMNLGQMYAVATCFQPFGA